MTSVLSYYCHDEFDIDVDVSPLLERTARMTGVTLIDDRYYRLAARRGRNSALQAKAEQLLDNSLMFAQWAARSRSSLDRRRAVRVPLISRVHVGQSRHMVAIDISMSGLRSVGEPRAPVMEIEFKLPGLDFPVDARVEVMSYKSSNVIPLVGLRFINLQRPFAESIARFIAVRRDRILRAA